jgi:hypothetical protein
VVGAVVGAEHMARGDQSPGAQPDGAPAHDADNPGEGVWLGTPSTADTAVDLLPRGMSAAALSQAALILKTTGRLGLLAKLRSGGHWQI